METVLLTVDEVARRLKCHPQTVRRWIWSGKLRHVKAGGLVRVPENAIRLLLEDGARPADGNDRRTGVAALRATMENSKENVTSEDVEDLTRVIREGERPAEWNSPVD
jgi:excisionase family DNA binding protein